MKLKRNKGVVDPKTLTENFKTFQQNLTREIADFGRDLDFMYNEYPQLADSMY